MDGSEGRRGGCPASEATSQREYWTCLYEQCHRQIQAQLARNVRCPHDVEDLVQDIFVNLIVRGGRLEVPETYIRTAARNGAYGLWRYQRRMGAIIEQAGVVQGAETLYCDWDSNPVVRLTRREIQQRVSRMVERLSPVCAEIVELRLIKGMNLEEAARHTGCSRDTLVRRLTRAKQALMKLCRSGKDDPVGQDHRPARPEPTGR